MKLRFSILLTFLLCNGLSFGQSEIPMIDFIANETNKKVDVMVDGTLFTSYIYPNNVKKPVLWPVISPGGNMLTRSYPMVDKAGDRTDHPHHVGVWLNYGDVNGLDFWNNSEAIPSEEKNAYGTIYHQSVEKSEGGKGEAVLGVKALWKSSTDEIIVEEETEFKFTAVDQLRMIDRTTTLTAVADEVKFTDNKEGMFAIRVARELELPSEKPSELMDAHGVVTKVENMDNTKVKGNYRSSEGIEGGQVWGTRAKWMKLGSEINGEPVSLVIIDNPSNAGYPTYWHARDYGLFAANTLGQKVFSEGKTELNFGMKKGESVTFKYRLVIASEDLTDDRINILTAQYTRP